MTGRRTLAPARGRINDSSVTVAAAAHDPPCHDRARAAFRPPPPRAMLLHVPSPPAARPLPLAILILTGFLSGAGMRVADPLLALIGRDFGVSVASAAPVVAAFTLVYGLAQPVLGPIGDRIGKLRLIAICMALYGAASAASAFAPTLALLVALRGLAGCFAGGLIPVAIAFIGDSTTYATRQATLGRFMTGMVLSNLVTAPGSGAAGDFVGWRAVFGLLGAAALAAAVPLGRAAAGLGPGGTASSVGALARYQALLARASARQAAAHGGCRRRARLRRASLRRRFPGRGVPHVVLPRAVCVLGAAGLGALLYTLAAAQFVRRFGERGLLVFGGAGMVVWLGGDRASCPPCPIVAGSELPRRAVPRLLPRRAAGAGLGDDARGAVDRDGRLRLLPLRRPGDRRRARRDFVLPVVGYRGLLLGAAGGIGALALFAVRRGGG
ncbi:MAG: MFS transporter [Acetobacteraceae bacterium]|nr:MFS transporter [Acetobacteraceae bacterium]